MKRIAIIRNSYSYNFGGAELFPISQAKILSLNGYEPVILSANKQVLNRASASNINIGTSPWWSFQNFSGLKILAFPIYFFWILMLVVWYSIYFVKNHIDIIHPQSRDDFIAATIAAKLLSRKIIWTDHADLKYIYMNHAKWYKNPVGKLTYFVSKMANKITIESFSEKKLIEASLVKNVPKNYTVIPIGVVDTYKPNERKNDKVVLVSTSRLITAKGIGELIDAMKLINNKNVVLKICGEGPEASHFKSMAKGIESIEFLGHVNDVGLVLSNSDILVHPSYHESFGLSVVEAEMLGLPVIACNVDSMPEIVEDGVSGILVPPKSSKDLADAIKLLCDSAELRVKMGKAGRQIYLRNFQLDKIVKEQIIPLYNEVA